MIELSSDKYLGMYPLSHEYNPLPAKKKKKKIIGLMIIISQFIEPCLFYGTPISQSQKLGTITLIPNGNKSRELLNKLAPNFLA